MFEASSARRLFLQGFGFVAVGRQPVKITEVPDEERAERRRLLYLGKIDVGWNPATLFAVLALLGMVGLLSYLVMKYA